VWEEGRVCGDREHGGYMGRRGDVKEKSDMGIWRNGGEGMGTCWGEGGKRVGAAASGRT